ncbi:MAG TPA: putative glycoside hydrolase [bacterium]|nr:putative glycoside hydrolase [bacterium]
MRLSLSRIIGIILTIYATSSVANAQSLVGAADGLYRLDDPSRVSRVLPDVEVRKIVRLPDAFAFLTSRGILFSRDLVSFEERNAGLPIKMIKTFIGGVKGFTREVQELKDLEVDPYDASTLVTCTKDQVFLTRDGGLSWQAIPSPAPQPGLKAVAVTSKPELLVFVSHAIKGPFVRNGAGGWHEIGGDLGKSDPAGSADEVSDIVVEAGPDGPLVWAANSFLPRIYRYDFATRSFAVVYKEAAEFASFDSLAPRADGLLYVTDGAVMRADVKRGTASTASAETALVLKAAALVPSQIEAIFMPGAAGSPALNLSELWLASFKSDKPYRAVADGRHGLYLQTGFMNGAQSRAKYDALMTDRGLDTVVLDLKDDFGRLRFEPKDPLIKAIGKTVNPLDVEAFVKEMKAKGRYLIARIVVFKDQRLHEYSGGVYAVWDGKENIPWRGYELETKDVPLPVPDGAPPSTAAPATTSVTERKYYGEYWVDPYCEKVWEYNVAIAREIISRGFDEVQFDYIRFPTDGTNLGDARFRWKDAGMDMESALMSFLSYARANIAAPISIDIYGANGWYRSGVRTGQDVEMLSRYVDAICPMFYPSHFEQGFMGFDPAVRRPYRIYYIGTMRSSYISRKRIVVRPYVQAFYLNVRYDREYYSPAYVALEVDGVRDSLNEGLLFWNNAGRYDDVPVLKLGANRRLVTDTTAGRLLD